MHIELEQHFGYNFYIQLFLFRGIKMLVHDDNFECIQRDDEMEIIKYIGKGTKELVIPNKINGIDVVDIQPHAFKERGSELTSITLPESLLYIREDIFDGCTNISSIIIPPHIITIFDDAFSGCKSLKTIEFTNAAITSIYPDFLGDCYTSLKKIIIHGRCPFDLMNYIFAYAIEHNIPELIEEDYLERVGQKSLLSFIELARKKEETYILQRLIVAYNKRFGNSGLEL